MAPAYDRIFLLLLNQQNFIKNQVSAPCLRQVDLAALPFSFYLAFLKLQLILDCSMQILSPYSDLFVFQVTTIQNCSQGINKVLGSLQQKFPSASKSSLRNKVREVSDYVDNRWQVCEGGNPTI